MSRSAHAALLALLSAACGTAPEQPAAGAAANTSHEDTMNFYSQPAKALDSAPADLAAMKGKVALVVNVASECGYTPQYAGLQSLHAAYKGRGFAVLGFPSNDFGAQEPGTPEQIRQFCTTKYKVDFPLFAKVVTKEGPNQSPVYSFLHKATGKLPNWNFCKYLVGKDGKVIAFYPSKVAPDDKELLAAIDAALK